MIFGIICRQELHLGLELGNVSELNHEIPLKPIIMKLQQTAVIVPTLLFSISGLFCSGSQD